MSNEPEQFDAIHAFVCASVAACFATIYPRANPEKFRELVARVARPEAPCYCPVCVALPDLARAAGCVAVAPLGTEAATGTPECEARTATQCLARERAEILAFRRARIAEAERLRTFLKDCFCPCCNARYRLRVIACESPASIHCASADGRDHLKDPGPCESALLEVLQAAAADAARRPEDIQALRAAAEGYHETDTDAR